MKNSRDGSRASSGRSLQQSTPSKNTDPSRGCDGKQKFETYSEAERSAQFARRSHRTGYKAYRCRVCRGFHYGSSDRKRSPMRKIFQLFNILGDVE